MSAGTITLTNNSATVTGSGTTFTDMVPGDFIVATVGGVTYTLAVSTVASATQVTLIDKYTGPTQSGLAWNLVPRSTQSQVTAELVAQATQALRGLNYDKANWQQVFSSAGSITVSLPDGSQFSGPSWKYMADQYNSKANASDVLLKSDNLASVGNKNTALNNLGYAITRSGNNIVRSSNGVIEMDFLIGATIAVGAFNAQTVGGITYYTHFYRFNLPQAMPNGIIVALASLIGDRFGNQNPGYNADIKVCRDKDDGSGLLTSYLTVSVKTPQTGWFPYFNIRVVGY